MIDAHCHITQYPKSYQHQLLLTLKQAGFEALMMGGISPDDWKDQLELQTLPGTPTILPVFGLHPWYLQNCTKEMFQRDLNLLRDYLKYGVAFGEIGLDFYIEKDHSRRSQQVEVCEVLLEVACEHQLPLVIHCVRAHHEMLRLLKNFRHRLNGGMVHSFVGHEQIARSYLDLGFCISISPFTTRASRTGLYQSIPDDFLLIETDAPQEQKPEEGWQEHNLTTPALLIAIAQTIATAKGIAPDQVIRQNRTNLLTHFPRIKSMIVEK